MLKYLETIFCVTFQGIARKVVKNAKIGTNFKVIVPCTVKKPNTGVYLSPMNEVSSFADVTKSGDASLFAVPVAQLVQVLIIGNKSKSSFDSSQENHFNGQYYPSTHFVASAPAPAHRQSFPKPQTPNKQEYKTKRVESKQPTQ